MTEKIELRQITEEDKNDLFKFLNDIEDQCLHIESLSEECGPGERESWICMGRILETVLAFRKEAGHYADMIARLDEVN